MRGAGLYVAVTWVLISMWGPCGQTTGHLAHAERAVAIIQHLDVPAGCVSWPLLLFSRLRGLLLLLLLLDAAAGICSRCAHHAPVVSLFAGALRPHRCMQRCGLQMYPALASELMLHMVFRCQWRRRCSHYSACMTGTDAAALLL
jgi:hypothetical protein